MIPIMNPIGMEYRELDGSPDVDVSVEELKIVRKFMMGWAYRKDFVNQCLGRRDVDQYHAFCTNAKVEKHPGMTLQEPDWPAFCRYDHAIVTLTFSTKDPPTATSSIEPSAEFLTIPKDGLKWGSGDAVVEDERPGKLFINSDLIVTWRNLYAPSEGWLLLVGTVNEEGINPYLDWSDLLINTYFPANTLLYTGVIYTPTYSIVHDEFRYDATLRLSHRNSPGWNHFWRPKTNTFERMYRGYDEVNLYEPTDLLHGLNPGYVFPE